MSAHAIRQHIISDVIDVWGVQKQYIVDRLQEPAVYPYCVINLNEIRREFNGVRSIRNEYRFFVTLVDKIHPETNIERLKELKALAIITRLEGDATYAGCYLPTVTNISFNVDTEHPAEMVYTLTVEFVCSADEIRA